MNIQQFQYILAVVDSKNFELAAEKCFVTQSTLSTMINKFEAEIGIKIFNRKTKPVSITKEGTQLIQRLRIVVNEIELLKNTVQELKGEMVGELKIGIIPTIAPYLLPLFINEFAALFPKVSIQVKEMTTPKIQEALLLRSLDIGILALPLSHKALKEEVLYEEPFLVYDCTQEAQEKKQITPEELNFSKMCLLEEGHCLRTQVYDICELSAKSHKGTLNFKFESGAMETLMRITEVRKGVTILPYLSLRHLSAEAQQRIVAFESPVPVRSVGLVTHQYFVKKALKDALVQIIQKVVAPLIPATADRRIVNPI